MIADVTGVDLKPCPFCGSEATLRMTGWSKAELQGKPGPDNRYWAKCSNSDCGITTQATFGSHNAITAWNTRAA